MVAGMKRSAPVSATGSSKKVRSRPGDEAASPSTSPSPSTAFTEQASVAETSMTSRSSKRPKRYVCEYRGCAKAFDRPIRLEAHVRTHNGDRPFMCDTAGCDKSFSKVEHLKAHVQNKHAANVHHTCAFILHTRHDGTEVECGKTFTTATRLTRHVAAHEAKEETRCKEPGCGLVFRKMDTLQRHVMKDHLNQKAFRCVRTLSADESASEGVLHEECGQTFSTIGQLKAHENRHHAGLQHFCEACSTLNGDEADAERQLVGFRTYADLQTHNRTVHPPICDLCQRAFPSSRALTAHMEIEHSSLASRQKFKCDYPSCERGFTRQGNLKVHYQTVHVKSKNYSCGQLDLSASKNVLGWDGHGCGMAFGTKAALESHVRTQHLQLPALSGGRKKFKSEDKSEVSTPMDFDELPGATDHGELNGTLSLLTGHGYEHERPLACWEAICSVRFLRDYDLGQHMETAHGWTVEQINDRFMEQQALEGDDFWVGGQDHGGPRLDPTEENLRRHLESALRMNAQNTAGDGLAGSLETGMPMDGQMSRMIREEQDIYIAVDPALM